jgi:glutamate 5-kinase
MSSDLRPSLLSSVRSIVVKLGSNVLVTARGALDHQLIARLAASIARLRARGISTTVVTSGAIAAGLDALGLPARPDDLPRLQACAAVGQAHLMQAYDQALAAHGCHAAQILITRDDFEHRDRYLNIRNCINSLAELGAVPILNENDTVGVDEIRYGENDIIAALVANNLQADLLILLTTVEGLYRDAARHDLVDVVEHLDERILRLADGTRSALGSGGMDTKLLAAQMVTAAGQPVVIASGRRENVLDDILAGRPVGTLFLPTPSKMNARQRWIAFTARSRGRLTVDDGAAKALLERGKSLLASGIVSLTGNFKAGDVVTIADSAGRELARGLTNYDAPDLSKIRGRRSAEFKKILGEKFYDEVVHRDNLVLRP